MKGLRERHFGSIVELKEAPVHPENERLHRSRVVNRDGDERWWGWYGGFQQLEKYVVQGS